MRPSSLELAGFTSFREPTVIDFEGAEYFALVGPTGAGKSTVIDAICFALYGSVPRYAHVGLVAPVISQGKVEARVRLDLTIGDTPYTVVRVVRAQGKGRATTKEARLESRGEVLAGTADEVTEQITGLIGLGFDQFTKCVVLPQGEFARFLHDKPAQRQDLLVRLLNLGVYDRMREAARARAIAAQSRVAVLDERLVTDLAGATEEALVAARLRRDELVKLKASMDSMLPRIAEIQAQIATQRAAVDEAETAVAALSQAVVPPELAALADDIAAARKLHEECNEALAAVSAKLDVALKLRAEQPDPEPLRETAVLHGRLVELHQALAGHEKELARATSRADAARAASRAAGEALLEARGALDALRHEHSAHSLASALVGGEPCPVCLQPVANLPRHRKPAGVATAEKKLTRAQAGDDAARAALDTATQEESMARTRRDDAVEQIAALSERLTKAPSKEEIAAALTAIDAADRDITLRRDEEKSARTETAAAKAAFDDLLLREDAARSSYEHVRDRLARLSPPPAKRAALADDWTALARWAVEQSERQRALAQSARTELDALTRDGDALVQELAELCAGCDVDPGDDVKEAVVAAHVAARHDVETIEKALADAAAARSERALHARIEDLAKALAEHLSAKPGKFESWIVTEALQHLVRGATQILHELSDARYALAIDTGGNFLVVDHDNADETRSAKTLSGGETFLASLALALALADQLADLAAEGAARLEAIFLDEGFGTLDPDTLETVATAVESLAAKGRMVGIVTHVAELAERVPLRYRVTKEATGSKIERLSA